MTYRHPASLLKLTVAFMCAAVSLSAGVIGCGDDDSPGAEIGCEWFQGDNCQKETAVAAQPCAADSTEQGTLSADGMICTYPDGTEIQFGRSALESAEEDYLWDFEIIRSSSSCLTFAEYADGSSDVTTSVGTLRTEVGGGSMLITCPNGDVYRATNPMAIIDECLGDLGGYSTSGSSAGASFTLIGGGGLQVHLFGCYLP